MPKRVVPLTAAQVKAAKPGAHCDGGGLYLVVRGKDLKFWVFKFTDPDHPYVDKKTGKPKIDKKGRPLPWVREMGLGPAAGPAAVSLADARDGAAIQRALLRQGVNPLQAKRDKKTAKLAAAKPAGIVFSKAAKAYIAQNEAAWKNDVHRRQWTTTLETYVYPHFGEKTVAEVTTEDVVTALKPIWKKKEEGGAPETASRVRGRIETVLDFAKAQGWREGENPARWKGHLDHVFPRRSKIAKVKHHAAVPWREMPEFWNELVSISDVGPMALRFAILTAARTTEVIEARWPEFDLVERLWVVPAERMKGDREHRVPLSDQAVAVLEAMLLLKTADDGFVFPGEKEGSGLSNGAMLAVMDRLGRDETPHGTARSSFRDWASEATSHPHEVAEMALAHAIESDTEAAYRRGDLLDRRRVLMEDWASYLSKTAAGVVSLADARSVRPAGGRG